MMMLELDAILSETESVCPECLARVPALRVARGENVYLKKACPTHGITQTIPRREASRERDRTQAIEAVERGRLGDFAKRDEIAERNQRAIASTHL